MNREMDGPLTIRDETEIYLNCSGRAGPGHHFTNGKCFADGNKFSNPQWEDKCMNHG